MPFVARGRGFLSSPLEKKEQGIWMYIKLLQLPPQLLFLIIQKIHFWKNYCNTQETFWNEPNNSIICTRPSSFEFPPAKPEQSSPLQYEPPSPPACFQRVPLPPPPRVATTSTWRTIILWSASPTTKHTNCSWCRAPVITSIHASGFNSDPRLGTWSTSFPMRGA